MELLVLVNEVCILRMKTSLFKLYFVKGFTWRIYLIKVWVYMI